MDGGGAAFTADPLALAVLQAAVRQDGSLVEPHAAAVLCFGEGKFVWMKKLPYGPVDDLVGSVAEDVDNGIRRVQDVGIVGEVCRG